MQTGTASLVLLSFVLDLPAIGLQALVHGERITIAELQSLGVRFAIYFDCLHT